MLETSKYTNQKKSVFLFLLFTIGAYYLLGALAAVIPGEPGKAISGFLRMIFAFAPFLAVLLIRIMTNDKSSWYFDIKVWKSVKTLLLCAFAPGAAVLLGAAIYYIFFPNELLPNFQSLFEFCARYGLPEGLQVNGGAAAAAAISVWMISAIAIPIHFRALGEEIGWRGFLLPRMKSFMSVRKAVLLHSVLWCAAHLSDRSLMEFNYGTGYWAPVTGAIMFLVLCVCSGIILS